MAARWMEAKKRQRRAYLKKQPAGKFNHILMRDLHGAGRHEHNESKPDWLDDIEPDYKKQRVWIAQQRRNQKQEQIFKPMPDKFYHFKVVDLPAYSLSLYFSGQEFFFVEEDVSFNYLRRSRVYPNRQQALAYYHAGKIEWVMTASRLPSEDELDLEALGLS